VLISKGVIIDIISREKAFEGGTGDVSETRQKVHAAVKFQVVMEIPSGTKAIGQIARSYGVHPVTLTHWKKEFIEKGPEIFSQQTTIQEYERRTRNWNG
jgi:transposase-like protein